MESRDGDVGRGETWDEKMLRRGYEVRSLMFPSRSYIKVVVATWSPVAQAYDHHYFDEGYKPEQNLGT